MGSANRPRSVLWRRGRHLWEEAEDGLPTFPGGGYDRTFRLDGPRRPESITWIAPLPFPRFGWYEVLTGIVNLKVTKCESTQYSIFEKAMIATYCGYVRL